ncbi:hypothetical protein RD792_014419 [Penstemon davidsonii]|uniref:AT-hook motif nuclear-localized protein n=1 Tax=Penstemon davidsonii TaxID=160366 RepID=A0ABR0CPE5_9LAMI|nr:hypothetical protein RD792_014419 [Penstemon davidsonii]
MDGREAMTLTGSASYYHNRGLGGSGGSGPTPNVHTSVFKNLSNPNIPLQHSNVGGGVSGSTFHVENPSPNFSHGMNMAMAPIAPQGVEPVKKKRGRPRKYAPEGANMSLALSPTSASKPHSEEITPGEKVVRRGRPPGSGWKQKLAPLGEWMNNSAGLAFTPHVLHVASGEDIAAKIMAFSQQRARALCILSASGSVSFVTLRQATTVTYEGRFEILCLSGSYLVAESGDPRQRTGGISISVCSPDGHIIGGAIDGRLMAANPVQVVACSFVYGGGTKAKNKVESEVKEDKFSLDRQTTEISLTPVSSALNNQSLTSNTGTSVWPSGSRLDVKNSDIDLTRG